ncbi:MAG: flavin reductase family protein [Candidatus Dormibacteria bacterium]
MNDLHQGAVNSSLFRAAARQVAAGVTVATATDGERSHAVTATAFCTLSLDPPLVLLALDRAGQLLRLVRRAGHIGVNVLRRDQQQLGEWAATRGRQLGRTLPDVETVPGVTGAPLLAGTLAWFDCDVESESEHGDHALVVARVVRAWAAPEGDPLIYYQGSYAGLERGRG